MTLFDLQFNDFIPHWVQSLLESSCFLLLRVSSLRDQFNFDVWVTEAIRVHWDQVPTDTSDLDYKEKKLNEFKFSDNFADN